MKNISRKTNRKNNVINIESNPRFRSKQRFVAIPKGMDSKGDFMSFELCDNLFGFMRGDALICRTGFNFEAIKPDALVIDETPNGDKLTVFSNAQNPVAVVVAFTREVKNGN